MENQLTTGIKYEELRSVRCNSCDSDLPFSVSEVDGKPLITVKYGTGQHCPECGDLFTGEYIYHNWIPHILYLKTKCIFDDQNGGLYR